MKRLLQVAMHAPAPFACGALMLVSEFLVKCPGHWSAIQQPRGSEGADDVEKFVDVDDDDDDDDDDEDEAEEEETEKEVGHPID